jgi:hypothetical protein
MNSRLIPEWRRTQSQSNPYSTAQRPADLKLCRAFLHSVIIDDGLYNDEKLRRSIAVWDIG